MSRLLSTIAILVALASISAQAQPAAESNAEASPVETSPEIQLPEFDPTANPEETLEKVKSLWQTRIDVASPQEANLLKVKILGHIVKGSEIILKDTNVDAELALEAIQNKMEALGILAQAGDPNAMPSAIAMAKTISEDPRPLVAREGKLILLSSRLNELQELDTAGRTAFVKELMDLLNSADLSAREVQIASITADLLEQFGDTGASKTIYKNLAEQAKKSDSPEMRSRASEFEGVARRLELPGNEIKIAGKNLAGADYDIKNHRGKVVLIQYWASWCGYCLEEMPHIKQMYNTYHADGFEVVGVNLDDSADRAIAIIDDMKLPWQNLFSRDAEQLGMENPNATRYGINSIPQCILVDRDGKVVTLNARGDELTRELEKLFLESVTAEGQPTKETPAQDAKPQ